MATDQFNNRLRQIILLSVIILLALLLFKQLYIFLPGFLGGITLYILTREKYFHLIYKRKWNKSLTALLFILISIIFFAIPIFLSIELLSRKIATILNNPNELIQNGKIIGNKIEALIGIPLLTDQNLVAFQKKVTSIMPGILNSSLNILSNFTIMFILLYFFLMNGTEIEKLLNHFIPLKKQNIELLSSETKSMIKANAIGIPILAVIQGIIATIGYWIFGVHDFVLWGFLSGVCSLIPIVGTGIIWVPLVAYFFATNNISSGIGLTIYAIVLITNIDYVARITILKKLIDVHPLITIFGVIVGIGLFGFWGVIFGPLLFSYFIILIKIYISEFSVQKDVHDS
jgi:predicted PurR-regulated permease PerM